MDLSNRCRLQQFYTSENGGQALGEVLFGHYNPSERLPLTFPRDGGSLPVAYEYLKSGRDAKNPGHVDVDGSIRFGRSYVTGTPAPWYEFGYGQRYSEFEYLNVKVDKSHVKLTETVKVTVKVKNTSSRDGWEVVQLYVVDSISSVVNPDKQLKGFKKVLVKAGEAVHLEFDVDVNSLGLWNAEMRYVVEPGQFTVYVARNAGDFRGNASFLVE